MDRSNRDRARLYGVLGGLRFPALRLPEPIHAGSIAAPTMSGFHIRNMEPGDREEIARLIYHSLNAYYESIGRGKLMSGDPLDSAVFFDVYWKTDEGEGIVAVDDESKQIIGSCFVHPRETHISLGIMNAHHDHFGRGVARALLSAITGRGKEEGKPVRLVSSCFNLDSYSLYTRGGFVPFNTFQDMMVPVPDGGLDFTVPEGITVREATLADVDTMTTIEMVVSGISRRSDYEYFIRNEEGFWHTSVVEGKHGLEGFLVSCGSSAFNMLGPGVAREEMQAAALIHAELNRHKGRSPILLVPVDCGGLVKQLYDWGARNTEMHVAQSFGPASRANGVVMPTFLPETG